MQNNKGATIIELLVVLSVFVFIIIVTISIFISVTQRQRSVLKEQELLNQTSYVIDYMSRKIRMAVADSVGSCAGFQKDYLLTRHDAQSGFYQGIKFISDDNNCYEFFLEGGIFKVQVGSTGTYEILSPSDFNKFTIKYVRFIINGDKNIESNSSTNLRQPRITTSFDLLTEASPSQKERIFQTTNSRRNLARLLQ